MPSNRRGEDYGNSVAGPLRTRRPFGVPGTSGRDAAVGGQRAFIADRQFEDYAVYSAIRSCAEIFEDFLVENTYTLAAATANPGPLVARQTGTPTGVAPTQNAPNGVVNATLAATNEAEFAGIDMADNRSIPMNKAFYFQTYLNLATLPAANAFFIAGLAAAYNATIANITRYVWFRLTANGNLIAESADGVTTNLAQPMAPTAQMVLVAGTNYLFTIVGKSQLGRNSGFAEFWIDDNFLGKLNIAGADSTTLQPLIGVGKSTGTAVTNVAIDYVRVMWDRF